MYSLDDPIETQGQADEAAEMVLTMSQLSGSLIRAKRAAQALAAFPDFAGDISEAVAAIDENTIQMADLVAQLDDALSIWQDKIEGRPSGGVV